MATVNGSRVMPSARIDPPTVTGIVLAGGESRRMGRDKAQLQWRGRPLLDHMRMLLLDAGCDQCLVSGTRPGFDHVPDRRACLGPLGGLESVIVTCPQLHDHLLVVVPVDMPLLTAGDLRQLWETAIARRCAAACFAGHALPAVLRNDARLPDVLRRRLARSGSVTGLLSDLGSLELPLPVNHTRFSNANTPAQWRTLTDAGHRGANP